MGNDKQDWPVGGVWYDEVDDPLSLEEIEQRLRDRGLPDRLFRREYLAVSAPQIKVGDEVMTPYGPGVLLCEPCREVPTAYERHKGYTPAEEVRVDIGRREVVTLWDRVRRLTRAWRDELQRQRDELQRHADPDPQPDSPDADE